MDLDGLIREEEVEVESRSGRVDNCMVVWQQVMAANCNLGEHYREHILGVHGEAVDQEPSVAQKSCRLLP